MVYDESINPLNGWRSTDPEKGVNLDEATLEEFETYLKRNEVLLKVFADLDLEFALEVVNTALECNDDLAWEFVDNHYEEFLRFVKVKATCEVCGVFFILHSPDNPCFDSGDWQPYCGRGS